MVDSALKIDKQKTSYVFGGGRNQKDIKNGVFDCSSFVHYAFKQAGVDLGELTSVSTETLNKKGTKVAYEDIQPGDLVFFDTYKNDGHVGIYIGNGKFVGAQTSTGVAVADMSKGYWKGKFDGHVRRMPGGSKVAASASKGASPSSTTRTASGSLGTLSARYESRGDVGSISSGKGDPGGKSYGTYQLTTKSGNAQKFANSYGGALKGKKVGTKAFDDAWKAEAKKNPTKFNQAQHEYILGTHYTPAAKKIMSSVGMNADKHSKALQDVIWSMSVQHGSGGAANIFKAAGIKKGMSDEQIIRALYKERSKVDKYFASSPPSTRANVKKRFQQELQDALNMLSGSNRGR